MNIKKVIKKKIYINLLVSVISTLATSANFAIASSVDSVPPSPSSIMKIRFNATKPNAIGSSSILWNYASAGIAAWIAAFKASKSTSGLSGMIFKVATTSPINIPPLISIYGPSKPHSHL